MSGLGETMKVDLDYMAAGGNRHPSAADWAPGILAFGAGHNVAIWDPGSSSPKGVTALLSGHTDVVNAVKNWESLGRIVVLSGGADNTIRIWTQTGKGGSFEQIQCLSEHSGSINTLSTNPGASIFASGAADGTVKIWDFADTQAKLMQSITLKPRCLPLACALVELEDGAIVMAVAGTLNSIQLYVRPNGAVNFEMQARLSGHEGWLRSLDFVRDSKNGGNDILLASASQDKFIRLWRFCVSADATHTPTNVSTDPAMAAIKLALSNKAYRVGSEGLKYSVTFEALLVGHDDWVHTARWAQGTEKDSPLQLLSASADNSLAIWQEDEASGVWVCSTRLGEISTQKGSTSATGSTGGFWIGLWAPDKRSVVSLGRTGSWRRWKHDCKSDMWHQGLGISGHTREVQSLAWAPDGSYLVSTGADQTTRLFAEWKREGEKSWHEFARPQIHGYDLNCIDTLTTNRFISGADEKLLRVFNKPKAVDRLLSKLCGIASDVDGELPDTANIPVLGLSNKAEVVGMDDDVERNGNGQNGQFDETEPSSLPVRRQNFDLDQPPFEEHLSRHTLWPEHEKLYGHGYEISAVAASHDGSIVATACKASSIDHAVIRLYECREWRQAKPSLTAHSLTVTALSFSPDDRYLLSVGRDRQWTLFRRDVQDEKRFESVNKMAKGHSRMILDCCWAPIEAGYVFVTAGRDKVVKVWKFADEEPDRVENVTSIATTSATTAVACVDRLLNGTLRLAYGTEDGAVHVIALPVSPAGSPVQYDVDRALRPSGSINSLKWRPSRNGSRSNGFTPDDRAQLAVASDDTSVRIFSIGP